MRRSTRLNPPNRSLGTLAKGSTSLPSRQGAARRDHDDVDESDAYEDAPDSDEAELARPAKRRKVATKPAAGKTPRMKKTGRKPLPTVYDHIFHPSPSPPLDPMHPSLPPSSYPFHSVTHHHPHLLSPAARPIRAALLAWFDTVFSARPMPWRKPFLDPASHPRDTLARRAYEVWISEVMLQQTRVAVAAAYWQRWTARWPTLHDLAAAAEDDVLAMWRGLGYYARARRAWEAARRVSAENTDGVLPDTAEALRKGVPGVGRYTAGAVAAIVWGRAEAMVDGNVVRVLCRQMGIRGEPKADRRVEELVWETAGRLVRRVLGDGAGSG